MSRRDTVPTGAPCWIDLSTSDMDGASSFYGALFGWKTASTDSRFGFYPYVFMRDDVVAGMMEQPEAMSDEPDSWCAYFKVDDVPSAIARAVAAGGQEIEAEIPAGELGSLGLVADPEGTVVGLRTSQSRQHRLLSEQIGSPCWIELVTGNLDIASGFYSAVFEIPVNPLNTGVDGPPYATIDADGEHLAGIKGVNDAVSSGIPAHWIIQFRVDDCHKTVRKAQDLGGTILEEPLETPDNGTIATVADPTGARFAIVSR